MLASLERAREAERRFLADASHELRTPLTALLGNVDYLARHGADDASCVAELEADAGRLARLADDLLALSREEAGGAAGRDGAARRARAEAAGGRVRRRADATASRPGRPRCARARALRT